MILLPAGNASEWTGATGNNTYLFPGSPSILIDAGVGRSEHVQAIAGALDGAPLDVVLITHAHADHVGGVPALLDRWPAARIHGGPGQPLRDGEVVHGGSVTLTALHTPGHSPDHFCFVDQAAEDVFCGDLARADGTVVIPFSRGGSLREYLESLRKVRDLQPARLLPSHGPIVLRPAALIDEYIAHRMERERQIKAALAAGCVTPEEIVARVYPGLRRTLLAAARETVLAHLEKLRTMNSEL